MAIYDVAAAINAYKADPAGSLQQGLSAGNAIYEMRRRRQEQAQDEKIRSGLAQFYRRAQPARTEMDVQVPDLFSIADQGASMGQMGGIGMMRDAGRYLPRANYLDTLSTVIPSMQKREIPAVPGGMDYQGAADFLAKNGRFEQAGQLAKLMELSRPQRAKYYGGDSQEVIDAEGQRKLIAMTEAGPVELPYQPVSKPKYKFMDDGTVIDEATVSVVGKVPVGMSPGHKMQWMIAQGSQNKPQMVTGADGLVYWLRPGEQLPEGVKAGATVKPATGEERNAAGYLSRMEAAENLLQGKQPFSGAADKFATWMSPGSDSVSKNMLMSDDGQQYQQAAMDWVRAKLRKESGAVIGKDEAEQEYRNYFPMPGDTPAKIAQKAQARKEAISALRISAGSAYQRPAGTAGWGIKRLP